MNKETFGGKGLNKIFTVYVVFEDLGARCGEIKEYYCEITQYKLFGIIPIKDKYNIRIFHEEELEDGHFYWELCNERLIYKTWFRNRTWRDASVLFLSGDGSDNRYTRGSRKLVFLSEYEAYNKARIFNCNAKSDVEQIKMSLDRLGKKYGEKGNNG